MRGGGLSGPPLLKATLALGRGIIGHVSSVLGKLKTNLKRCVLCGSRTYHMSPSHASSSSESGSIHRSFQRMPPSSRPPHTI